MDDFERELNEMLSSEAAGIPASYDAPPELLARARRRRASKLGGVTAAVLVVALGSAAAVAQVVDRDPSHGAISTASPTTSTSSDDVNPRMVSTVACRITDPVMRLWMAPPKAPRIPKAGDPALFARLRSFAATDSPRYTVLAPKGWSCRLSAAADGSNHMLVYDSAATQGHGGMVAPISIENDSLWHGGVGSGAACQATDDPALRQYVTQNFPQNLPCPRAGRKVTHLDAHRWIFRDQDGSLGAAWMLLPSSPSADDGQLSILTCRPGAGLTASDCNTIIADYVARNDAVGATTPSTTTTTTTATGPGVGTVACPVLAANTQAPAPPSPSMEARVPAAGDRSLFGGFTSFAGTIDTRYVVLGPKTWSCQTQFSEDGDNAVVVYPAASLPGTVPPLDEAPVAIENDWMWHGLNMTPCTVSTDPAVIAYAARVGMTCAVPAGRQLTRIDAHVSTFVDADGSRGVVWMQLPSSQGADGLISVLTCRPTEGLTAADCGTIIADFAERVDHAG